MSDVVSRIVLLNMLESRSISRNSREFPPPIHSGLDLLGIINSRRTGDFAIEYINAEDDDDEDVRRAKGEGKSLIWLKELQIENKGNATYVTMLFEKLNHLSKKFAVADLFTRQGKHLRGGSNEVGALTTHLCVKLPASGEHDAGSYRCVLEYVPGIVRKDIEVFLCRQLRRHAKSQDFTYPATVRTKKGKLETKSFKYRPRLELFADIGHGISFNVGASQITQMVFTKKKVKQNTAKEAHVIIDDFVADVEHRISANDGPEDVQERLSWLSQIKKNYLDLGYEAKVYFRNLQGKVAGGRVTDDVSGAADLLMSPKAEIDVSNDPDPWRATLDADTVSKLRGLLDSDDLWAQNRRG